MSFYEGRSPRVNMGVFASSRHPRIAHHEDAISPKSQGSTITVMGLHRPHKTQYRCDHISINKDKGVLRIG